jgi:hypothetical protein
MFSYAHEQKHMGVRLIGVANKTPYLWRLWALPNDLKHSGAGFSTTSIDLLCLRVAQMPRSRHLAIFVLTTVNRQTDTQTNCFTPAAYARTRGNYTMIMSSNGWVHWCMDWVQMNPHAHPWRHHWWAVCRCVCKTLIFWGICEVSIIVLKLNLMQCFETLAWCSLIQVWYF